MMYARTIFLLLCSLLTVLILHSSPAASQEQSASTTFGYDEGNGDGPSNWGNLNADWAMCRDGRQQSPIDVNSKNVRLDLTLDSLTVRPYASQAIVKNRGYDIQVEWPNGAGLVTISGKKYVLSSLHWHFPSEHTFNGVRFPLEMHMVHQSSDGQIAVIGIIFKTGQPEPFLSSKLMGSLSQQLNPQTETNVGLCPPPTVKSGTSYYTYSGSLTTPPCIEGVTWILLQEIRTVSHEQLDLLKSLIQFNKTARPIQPLNGRTVSLYKRLF